MTSRIPQVIVTLSPEGELQLEVPCIDGGVNPHRRIIPLTQANAGQKIARMLAEQKKKIDGEKAAARRQFKQPDWRLIAKHPQVEIREYPADKIHKILAKDKQITQAESTKSAEDMGL